MIKQRRLLGLGPLRFAGLFQARYRMSRWFWARLPSSPTSSLLLLGFLLAAAVVGCQQKNPEVGPASVAVVPVSHPVQRTVTDFVDFTGRTDAVHSVNIIARVTGYLTEMPFKEGSEVKKGDLLFVIDPRPYQAQLDQALSQVKLNEAQLDLAKTTLLRYEALDKSTPGAVSKQALDQYRAAVDEAEARLDAQTKSLEIYNLNKEFTQVVSPIDGQVSRYYLTLGNLVNQDQTLLTTVVSLDPMYAYFDMDERTLLQIRKAITEGKITVPRGWGHPGPHGVTERRRLSAQGNDQLRQQRGQLHDGQHHDAWRVRESEAAASVQATPVVGGRLRGLRFPPGFVFQACALDGFLSRFRRGRK